MINLLQELAVEKYEGSPCTSGFVFVKRADSYTGHIGGCYTFEQFKEGIYLNENFFSRPSSYRYIDGRNSFYVVDNWQRVVGILRCTDPSRYSLTDRAINAHITPFFEGIPSKVWVAYIGHNSDVNIVQRGRCQLRWMKSHWHFFDPNIVTSLLLEYGFVESSIDDLLAIIVAISNLRLGTLILIPNDDAATPVVVGSIDNSELGKTLTANLKGKKISELREVNSAVGMLTSDGLTTISKDSTVIRCGDIIGPPSSIEQVLAGGSRTQAALSASRYGLVIKVSEDGPISFFREQREVLRIPM